MTSYTEPQEKIRWVVDPEQTSVGFSVKTFWGLLAVRGRFDRFEGVYDTASEGTRIELTIDPDSLTTGNAKRDAHLRSSDFFHVGEHPVVRFSSTRVRHGDYGRLLVQGLLEAAGKVVPLEFEASVHPAEGGTQITAVAEVDPRELGMSSGHLRMIRSPAVLEVTALVHPEIESAQAAA